jgi:hypothetical protein
MAPFDLAAAELRKLGVILTRLPGEYRVNFPNADQATARTFETLDEVVAEGRAMAAERGGANATSGGPRRRRRTRRMTPKAFNRRLRMRQLRRLRARVKRQLAAPGHSDSKGSDE